MAEAQYEALLRDNTEMQRALSKTKEAFEQERADKENLMTLFEDYKGQFERVKQECFLSQKKLTE
jgi:ribosome-binding protein aMBF1 (putative translation factor)